MMIFKSLLFALLLSSTAAAGMRRLNDDTLGELFLEAVRNATGNGHSYSIQRDGSFNAEVKGEFMDPLYKNISGTCSQLGRIEYSSSYADSQTGDMQSFSLTCRFEANETYDMAWQVLLDNVMRYEPASTSFSTNSYVNSIPNMEGQQKGLEMLIKMANTVEEVMLVVPSWQNVVSNYNYPPTSSISFNINKVYEDPWLGLGVNNITEDDAILESNADEISEEVSKSGGK